MREDPRREIRAILAMLLCVAVPVALTHATVRVPLSAMRLEDNPTPYGYTVSLLLFLVPILFVGHTHIRKGNNFDQKAFLTSAGIMAGIGAILDVAFGYSFFLFPNRDATLGWRLPAWDWSSMGFVRDYLPVEEFGFYILGAIFMAAVYLWAGQRWLAHYQRSDYEEAARNHKRLIRLSPHVVVLWAILLLVGMGYRWLNDGGFAGYFMFVMAGGALPTLLLIRTVKAFVNWHAMAFAFIALVFVSVIWEASLGVPYLWWTYRHEAMMGIFIPGWSNLPLEAVMVWSIGVWDAVLIYESLRVFFRQDLKPRHRLFGAPAETSP